MFVAIYLAQWLPYLVYAFLLLITGDSPYEFNLVVVTLTNSGGIFNALAYQRFVRRQRAGPKGREASRAAPPSVATSHTTPGSLMSAS